MTAAIVAASLAGACLLAAVILTVAGHDATPAWGAFGAAFGAAIGVHIPGPKDPPVVTAELAAVEHADRVEVQ